MRLAMVDCRSLIQFCRAFHPHNSAASSRARARRFSTNSLNPFSDHLCNHSPLAALDFIILLSVLASLAFLIFPYFKLFLCDLLPILYGFLLNLVLDDPIPYFIGFVSVLIGIVLAVAVDARLRKCGNPHCRGLRRAVEYDIQLETENCVKYSPTPSEDYVDNNEAAQLELGQDQEELEAELKKMAPPNGRTVLIFRAPCGCPAGRLEVWGPKKVRRIKK
ncbi:ribosomal protein L34e superfamily protein [Striga asiatica]|uniref:Ribosomal protein L34e superfamily protein n=1 Tax=Striga asiatica TaxID=4170 RepID=A0A5A7Q9X1_STRAF|nr:ribosomal protein L34e superfamily protein [Striga asiatica]